MSLFGFSQKLKFRERRGSKTVLQRQSEKKTWTTNFKQRPLLLCQCDPVLNTPLFDFSSFLAKESRRKSHFLSSLNPENTGLFFKFPSWRKIQHLREDLTCFDAGVGDYFTLQERNKDGVIVARFRQFFSFFELFVTSESEALNWWTGTLQWLLELDSTACQVKNFDAKCLKCMEALSGNTSRILQDKFSHEKILIVLSRSLLGSERFTLCTLKKENDE